MSALLEIGTIEGGLSAGGVPAGGVFAGGSPEEDVTPVVAPDDNATVEEAPDEGPTVAGVPVIAGGPLFPPGGGAAGGIVSSPVPVGWAGYRIIAESQLRNGVRQQHSRTGGVGVGAYVLLAALSVGA